ncbi:alpha-N-acetylglucosaminidase C-terminal domain-containing protein (plasmid) [Kitasatospora sp. NBC_00070]|uniref:alpha-N-acetylglucosaminidase n=1 Tax=Kitasatospora sp. NBC_00070 TaxID=2975962 RepID=UPI002F909923
MVTLPAVGRLALAALLALSGTLATAPAADAAPAFDTAPAAAALGRLIPAQQNQITLLPVAKDAGNDSFSVSGSPGAITVSGTSPATLLTGVGWYLENIARVDIGLPGDSLGKLPALLPGVGTPVSRSATVPHRYALNDTDAGYSGAYRDFASYQREMDVLALHGINEVFVQTGAEYPYYKALQAFGYSAAELRSWFPGPAHQSWWLLQNMSSFAGPVSEQLIAARVSTGRQVTDYLRSLGMTPVLPGYFGTVPAAFATRNPDARVVPQGNWVGFNRPDWLDPTSAAFPRLAAAYYQAQREAFGDSSMYKMDLLHEGGSAGSVDVSAAAGAVQRALLTAHPGAVWSLLGWESNPSSAVLSGADRSKMLILDGLADRYDNLNRESQWQGTPYAFGTIPNFGGHTSPGANTAVWVQRFQQWRTKTGSALKGIAYMPEATGTDPAAFDLFSALAWGPSGVDQTTWFAGYAARRYGGADVHATAAWEALRRGPYSMPSGSWSEAQDSLFAARPSLAVTRGASWSPPSMRYDAAQVRTALDELLLVAPSLQGSDAYRFDLVNFSRQVLDNRARTLLPQIAGAYNARNLTLFRSLAGEWNADLALVDRVSGADARSMVGPWIAAARSWGTDATERNRLEYDVRSLLTTWGPRAASDDNGLHDYANRDWAGLVSGLYGPRWAAYFSSLDKALTSGSAPRPIDWYAMDDAWARQTASYPTAPTGDPVALAREVARAVPGAAAVPTPGTGRLVGIGGKCVDTVYGATSTGTALQLNTCGGATTQTWTLPGDGTIRTAGKCADTRSGAVAAGTPVQLAPCSGAPSQSWALQADLTVRNAKSGLCLDASGASSSNGTRLIIWPCAAATNQQWRLTPR